MLELDTGGPRSESPVDGSLGLVALGFQGCDLSLEDFLIADAAI